MMVIGIPVLLLGIALVGGVLYLMFSLFTKTNDGSPSSVNQKAPTLDNQPGPSAPAETASEKERTL